MPDVEGEPTAAPSAGPLTEATEAWWSYERPPSHAVETTLIEVPTRDGTLIGVSRHIVVADTDEAALAIARRAYPRWHQSFNYLFQLRGGRGPVHQRPAQYDKLKEVGQGIAGSPDTVARFVQAQMSEAGTNYLVGQFAFGDLSPAETTASLELFAKQVMPQLQ